MTPADDIRLSAHFTLAEATRNRHGLPNYPDANSLLRMRYQAEHILEPVRSLLGGKPITVTSFYRNPEVNRKSGGDPNSAHMFGRATDIYIPHMNVETAFKLIKDSGIQYDKLIYETELDGSEWIHIQHQHDGQKPRGWAFVSYQVRSADGKIRRIYDRVP